MRTEVEIKAWVDDPEALRSVLTSRYPHEGSFVKEDVYFRLRGGDRTKSAAQEVEFRLRVENGDCWVTAKRKSVTEGVEVNEEIELGVSDAETFKQFSQYLGAVVFARKRKSGDRYLAGNATIEFCRVDGLGDFVEIERLIEDAGQEEIEAANRSVRSLLRQLGIADEKIEPRYYVDMLAELDGRPDGAATDSSPGGVRD